MNTSYKRGFTLIELLVVIAIIGILASIVLASLDSARKKGRDARRIADVKQIQLALELYYDANGVYPPALTSAALVTPGYISVLPTDPLSGSTVYPYSYAPFTASASGTICSSYHLGADLETAGSSSLASDADLAAATASAANGAGLYLCGITGAPSADFAGADGGKCDTDDPGVTCYDVRP